MLTASLRPASLALDLMLRFVKDAARSSTMTWSMGGTADRSGAARAKAFITMRLGGTGRFCRGRVRTGLGRIVTRLLQVRHALVTCPGDDRSSEKRKCRN